MPIGVVTGLAQEAECLRLAVPGHDLIIACAGANSGRASTLSRELIESGVSALVSFGVAGGLAPGIKAGTLVLPKVIVSLSGRQVPTDPHWRKRLKAGISWDVIVDERTLVGTERTIVGSNAKAQLHRDTAAVCVDLESLAVAEAAEASDRPFLAVRAIADQSDRKMPVWLGQAVDEDGRTKYGAVLGQIARRPWQIPDLVLIGRDFRAALQTLGRVAVDAGPTFEFFAH